MKPIWALCTILALVGSGFTAYEVLTPNLSTAYGYKDADQQSAIEAVAIRCFVDRDAETYSWSNDQKIQLVAHRFCSSRASGVMPGDDVAAQSFRMAFQVSCEATMIERARNNK